MFNFSPILKAEPHQSISIQSNLCKEECLDHREKWQNYPGQTLEHTIQKINKCLSEFCQFQINDFNSNSFEDKYRILQIISFLIQERGKLIQTNARLSNYRRKSDQYLIEKEEMLQKVSKEQKDMENQKDLLTLKKQNMERVFKQNNQKLISQKDEISKQLKKIQARQKAYQAQFRKKDNQIKFLQDGIKKIQEKSQSKSHFQLTQRMQKSKGKQQFKDGNKQYNNLALYQVQETIRSFSKQNNILKQFLSKTQNQLNQVFQLVNYKAKLIYSQNTNQDTDNFILKITRPDVFKSQSQWQKQNLEELCKNIRKLKAFINQKLGVSQTNYSFANNQSKDLKNHRIKDLLQNYKQIVVSQDQVLNKVMLKSQMFGQHENQFKQVCTDALDNFEFDKIRNIIQDQLSYMESKNKQLLSTKQKLSRDLDKVYKTKGQIVEQKMSLFAHPN